MDEHPKASTQIRENPQLVYDGKFLKSHPEVERFLKARPELREEIAQRPGRVFASYDRDDSRHGRYDRDDRPLDGGTIKADNDATLNQPGHAAVQRQITFGRPSVFKRSLI